MLSVLLFIAALCLLLLHFYKFATFRPENFPPGPPRLPIWGSYWFVLLNNYKFLHIGYHKLAQKYKTKILGLHLGPIPAVVVNSYELLRDVYLRPEFQGRVKLPLLNVRTYNKNLGVIFTDEQLGERHKRFSLRYLRDLGFGRRFPKIEAIAQEEIQDVLDLLHERRQDKEIFRDGLTLVPDIFYSMFFNTFWFMMAGERFAVKEHDKLRKFTREGLRFQKSVDVTGDAVALTPWLRHFAPKMTGFTDLMESTANMLKHMEVVVNEHKETYSEDHIRDFIDYFIKEMRKNKDLSFTDEQLHVVGFDYLLPVSTTATSTLTYATVFLLNYPDVQVKMQKELDTVIGRDRLPTLDDRKNLPYCEAVLRETMRKETIVPLAVVHRATEDTNLGGYNIPKDSAVITNLWSFHNDKEFWGDPEVFRPERFLDEDGKLLKKDYSLPFGLGKRVCAGETFARYYMFLLFTSIMQSFNIRCAPGTFPPTPQADLPGIIITKKGFWTRFEPRT